ncbi:MAG TPA: hypothetical protein VEA69_11670, partial [Tepidisphaeraceae bacterium]|nr:hypothetical protein [Tepidisphaeraceae bacterium]
MLTDADLAAIERRCDAATPGPWTVLHNPHNTAYGSKPLVVPADGSDLPRWIAEVNHGRGGLAEAMAWAKFIAAARQDVPALVAEV